MKVARAAGIVSTAAAIVVIIAAFAGFDVLVYAAAAIAAIAGAAGVLALPRERAEPAPLSEAPPEPRPEPTVSVLLATIRNAEEGSERLIADLHRVLAGIIADERGKIDRSEPHTIVALFTKRDHAGAAVHAARRMLSNVDAVSRRLGHELGITIGIHAGPRGEETVSVTARIQEAASDSVPILVSAPAAALLGDQLERVDTVVTDGWSLDVFTIPPAQKRLPGF